MSAGSEPLKVGDKVRVGPGMRNWPLRFRQGEVLTVTRLYAGAFLATDAAGETYGLYTSEVERVNEAQTIEVGGTVKATHAESGSVVQGVVQYLENGEAGIENIEFQTGVDERFFADVYVGTGWTFEVVSKAVKPPRVGDVVKDADSLPLGTMVKTNEEGASILLTDEGWIDQYNYKFHDSASLHNETTIVYIPESAND